MQITSGGSFNQAYKSRFLKGTRDTHLSSNKSKLVKVGPISSWTLNGHNLCLIIGGNKFQILKASGFPCGEIGFINVCAPNNLIDFLYGSW